MPSHLVSLKRSPSSENDSLIGPSERDLYPVTLYLSGEEVTKLGLQSADVGDELYLTASVKVTSKSTHQQEGGEERHNVTLALTEAAVEGAQANQEARQAKRLFGES